MAAVLLGSILEHYVPALQSEGMQRMVQASLHEPWLALLGIGIAAPLFEEILFRGVLFRVADDLFGPMAAVFSTSALFAVAHLQYNVLIMIALFVMALILGMVRLRSGSVWPSFLLHAGNNIAATLLALNSVS